jgi:hypothetical protein
VTAHLAAVRNGAHLAVTRARPLARLVLELTGTWEALCAKSRARRRLINWPREFHGEDGAGDRAAPAAWLPKPAFDGGSIIWSVPACVFVSELVVNAVNPAGTTMTLRVSHRPRFLLISAEDGSEKVPEVLSLPADDDPGPGRGLAPDRRAPHPGGVGANRQRQGRVGRPAS